MSLPQSTEQNKIKIHLGVPPESPIRRSARLQANPINFRIFFDFYLIF